MNEALDALEQCCKAKDRRKTYNALIMAIGVIWLVLYTSGLIAGIFNVG